METLIDGAKQTLIEAVDGLIQTKIQDYIIIGGWCPYLNRGSYTHPGTLDVDILFDNANETGYLKTYIKEMYKQKYFSSAKHRFQLLNVKDISGKEFCFNIDLLHTAPTLDEVNLFVDHLDLNVYMTKEERKSIKTMSIVQFESKVLFKEELFYEHKFDDKTAKIVNFTGMFLTKMISCQKAKRDRDSYDIFLGFVQNKIDSKQVKHITTYDKRVEAAYAGFVKFLKENEDKFNKRVKQFYNEEKYPSKFILSKLE